MAMTVGELLNILEDLPEDAEVRLAMQPSYPFEYSIGDVVTVAPEYDNDPGRVYLAEGRQLNYLPGDARAELGWHPHCAVGLRTEYGADLTPEVG